MQFRTQLSKRNASLTHWMLVLISALLLTFLVTACGDEGSNNSDTSSDTTADTNTAGDSATIVDTNTTADSATVADTGTNVDTATVAEDTGTGTGGDTDTEVDTNTEVDTSTQEDTATGQGTDENYLIADHTVVDAYANIPQQYIDTVKGWLVDAAGESHSAAYRSGMNALAAQNSLFAVDVFDGGFPAATTDALRLGRHASVGEEDFWTNEAAVNTIKDEISAQHTAGNPIHVIFQAWCWDMTRTPGAAGAGTNDYDSVFGIHWYGSSVGGPEGDYIWGLDSSDNAITGNSVSLQTYLDVVDGYNTYASENGIITQAIFSTGPVDGGSAAGERGYQRYIKHEAIRDYVKQGGGRILFDYGDILAYSDSGSRHMETWTSPFNSTEYSFPAIHPDHDVEETGHIANSGALRIAKAMWWLLARMAGWDGQ